MGWRPREDAALVGISYRNFSQIVVMCCEPTLLMPMQMEAVFHRAMNELFDVGPQTKTAARKRPPERARRAQRELSMNPERTSISPLTVVQIILAAALLGLAVYQWIR